MLTSFRGWFGCKDKTTTSTTSTIPISTTTPPTPTATSTTCETPGKFWGCYDQTSEDPSVTTTEEHTTITSPPTMPTTSSTSSVPSVAPTEEPHETCVERAWYGMCREWDGDSSAKKEDM